MKTSVLSHVPLNIRSLRQQMAERRIALAGQTVMQSWGSQVQGALA